jgi:hypothetical protein
VHETNERLRPTGNELAVDTILILTGVACIIGAIIGGGVKLVQIELSPVASLWRQIMLGIFGAVLVVSGLVAGGYLPLSNKRAVPQSASASGSAPPTSDQRQTSRAGSQDGAQQEKPTTENAGNSVAPAVPAQTEASSPPPARPSLPSKVDIFWCVTDSVSAANETTARRVMSGLRATNQIARLRVRPLQQSTNAEADYRIFSNIVRYDPDERPAAEEIARMASESSGVSFEPAPALPGTPSIDYLSVFVCAPS